MAVSPSGARVQRVAPVVAKREDPMEFTEMDRFLLERLDANNTQTRVETRAEFEPFGGTSIRVKIPFGRPARRDGEARNG
jgi:hypothetical protein